MINLSVICVVYNVMPEECSTLTSIESLDLSYSDINIHINVWDNSTVGFGPDSLSFMGLPFFYQHSSKNSSLAEAYNQIIKVDANADYYIILDDDSVITQEYFESVVIFINSCKQLALPKIFHSGKLISPGKIQGVRGKKLFVDALQTGENKISNFTAMMSGAVIKRSVFDFGIKFDEQLSLYGIDTKFFLDFQKKFDSFYLMDVSLEHDSALRNDDLSINNKLIRLENLFKSWYVVFCEVNFFRAKLAFYIVGASLKLAVKRRSFKYLSLLKCIRFK